MKAIELIWLLPTLLLSITTVLSFDINKSTNLVGYWGQNSYGNSESAKDEHMEKPLADYCRDSTYDVIVLSFLIDFQADKKDGYPVLNLGKHCQNKFPNTDHSACPEVAMGIKYCQQQGKAILLSMGGYAGDYTIRNDNDAENLANRLWDIYLGGNAEHRPFGDTVLDGIDLDIEKGLPESYAVLTNKLKAIFNDNQKNKSKRKFYISAAPQCPFPDQFLKNTLEHGWLDLVFVQFYNNPCSLGSPQFNFGTWDKWANKDSKNKKVKIFLGAPASITAAGSGYLEFQGLEKVIKETKQNYNSFGGVMLWDISQANMNLCKETKKLFSVSISHSLKGKHPVSQPGIHKPSKNRIVGKDENSGKVNRPDPTKMEKVEKLPKGVNSSLKSNVVPTDEETGDQESGDSSENKEEPKEKETKLGDNNKPKVPNLRNMRSFHHHNVTEISNSPQPTPITSPTHVDEDNSGSGKEYKYEVVPEKTNLNSDSASQPSSEQPPKPTRKGRKLVNNLILKPNSTATNTTTTPPSPQEQNTNSNPASNYKVEFDDGQYRPDKYTNYKPNHN